MANNDVNAPIGFDSFSVADGLALGQSILQLAQSRGLSISIGVDMGEQVVFRAALPGTSADNQTWIERKFAAVRRFGRSSYSLEIQVNDQPNFAQERALDPEKFALVGGAIPILVGGTLVGVVGVSGLPSKDDHALVVEAMSSLLSFT